MVAPSRFCSLDWFPTSLLKEVINVLLPFITSIVINYCSQESGEFLASLKHGLVTTLLRKWDFYMGLCVL